MEIDRRRFLASVGAGALAVMTPEDKAEALEHYMCDLLDGDDPDHVHDHHHGPVPRTEDLDPRLLDENDLLADAAEAEAEFAHEFDHDDPQQEPERELEQEQELRAPRGTGNLFRPGDGDFEPLPANPTLEDFFRRRFWPARHVLQSATHALNDGHF